MVIRPARLGDFDVSGKTVRGLVMEDQGKVIAHVAYYVSGSFAYVFSWSSDEAKRRHKVALARAARRFLDNIGLPQSCVAQGPESEPFLRWLGFEFAGEFSGQRCFVRGAYE